MTQFYFIAVRLGTLADLVKGKDDSTPCFCNLGRRTTKQLLLLRTMLITKHTVVLESRRPHQTVLT